jgi:UDPglucose 6-dehydrogenase
VNISVFGCELTGTVTAGCLAKKGNSVKLVSLDDTLERSKVGINLTYGEPSLAMLVSSQLIKQNLVYSSNWNESIAHADIIIISIPPWFLSVAKKLVERIGEVAKKKILIINQTTFSVGQSKKFEDKIAKIFKERSVFFSVSVLSMPDLISRGTSVEEFLNPSRIILGGDNADALNIVSELMLPFYKQKKYLKIMSSKEAEYTKFSLNAILATRVSLINELANSAELFAIDFSKVKEGIGSDPRIGFNYIDPGCGFGGPSFASDLNYLSEVFEKKGADGRLLSVAIEENETQKEVLFRKAWRFFNNDLANKTFAIWGLSFKPNTSSVDNAPSLTMIKALVAQGAKVIVYDPKANEAFMQSFGDISSIAFADDMYELLEGVDALFLLTEWEEFLTPDFTKLKRLMKQSIIFDGRNVYEPNEMLKEGIKYIGIGRGIVV